MKQVLVLAYRFPPMGGVGTRRWAKFSKFLAARGYSVRILTIGYPYFDKVTWARDVKSPGISIHRIDPGYPAGLLSPEQGIAGKVCRKIFRAFVENRYYFIDQAQMWGSAVVPAAIKLIRRHEIPVLVATGAPFTSLFHAARVKNLFPDLKLVLDYRDQWNGDPMFEVGRLFRTREQKKISMAMERFAISRASAVTTVSAGLSTRIAAAFPDAAHKIHTLYNGFDPDDFSAVERGPREFTILYAGTLSTSSIGRWEGMEYLAAAIKAAADPFISENLRVRVFKTGTKDLTQAINESGYRDIFRRNFEFHDPVPPDAIARECANSFCCLSINAKGFPYAFTSKVFDYMASGSMLMLISEKGELYDRLEESGQYTAQYDPGEIAAQLKRLKKDFLSDARASQVNFNHFSLVERTGELEAILEK